MFRINRLGLITLTTVCVYNKLGLQQVLASQVLLLPANRVYKHKLPQGRTNILQKVHIKHHFSLVCPKPGWHYCFVGVTSWPRKYMNGYYFCPFLQELPLSCLQRVRERLGNSGLSPNDDSCSRLQEKSCKYILGIFMLVWVLSIC